MGLLKGILKGIYKGLRVQGLGFREDLASRY